MFKLTKISVATAICTAVAVSALSVESRAGVMSITDKSSVSLTSMTDQVHWRRYYHRHLGGWRYGWRHYGYRYPSNVYGYSAPSVYGYSAPLGSSLGVAAAGNYCATDVKTCLLYEPGWLGTGCSCKVPDGRARGTVVQ